MGGKVFLRWKGGKVKWWKGSPETRTIRLYTVSSRASLLDPGSSLLEIPVERWNDGTRRFSDRLYCTGACIAPIRTTTQSKNRPHQTPNHVITA